MIEIFLKTAREILRKTLVNIPEPPGISPPDGAEDRLSKAYIQLPQDFQPHRRTGVRRQMLTVGISVAAMIAVVATALVMLPKLQFSPMFAGQNDTAYTGDGSGTSDTGGTQNDASADTYTASANETSISVGISSGITTGETPSTEASHTKPLPASQAIVWEWIDACDSIAAMVGAYPEHHACMTFYEGDGFAYMEVKDRVFDNLQIVFEDYRTGKMYLFSHEAGYFFSPFWFAKEGMVSRPLGQKGSLQEFRAAAFGPIKPALLDYVSFVKGQELDDIKMFKFAYDKNRILDDIWYYYAFDMTDRETNLSYFANDREYLGEFMDFYLSLQHQEHFSSGFRGLTTYYSLSITVAPYENYDSILSTRTLYFGTDGKNYIRVHSTTREPA